MTYSNGSGDYSSGSCKRLNTVVNKFYVSGDMHVTNGDVNNGIQHTIAAERTGDVHVYNNIESHVQNVGQVNYVVNLDNRKVDFISPYIGGEDRRSVGYAQRGSGYLLPDHSGSTGYDNQGMYEETITQGLLKSKRPVTQFIEDSEDVRELVLDTFQTLTGQEFPDDIVVRVLGEEEMKKAHAVNGGVWNPGIMGFALNRPGISTVVVRKNNLDALMLTLGHEIGHVLSERLGSDLDEEAKAFAFELAWVNCIVEKNIGGLGQNFDVDFVPAANGLHDRAFAFVQEKVRKGADALKVWWEIAKGKVKNPDSANSK